MNDSPQLIFFSVQFVGKNKFLASLRFGLSYLSAFSHVIEIVGLSMRCKDWLKYEVQIVLPYLPFHPTSCSLPPFLPVRAEHAGAEHVKHLTDGTFDAELAGKDHAIVVFYAPWYGRDKGRVIHVQGPLFQIFAC